MIRSLLSLAVLLTAVPLAAAQGTPVVIRPAAAPTPALKYQLHPEPQDVTPGNAAPLYYRAIQMVGTVHRNDKDLPEKTQKWLKLPLNELPLDEVRDAVAGYRNALRELDLAARRERCDWELQWREEGFTLIIEELQGSRDLARVLCLRARLEMATKEYDKAFRSLQGAHVLARHVAEPPQLIAALVGVAIHGMVCEQLLDLAQAPDAPNLYWALTTASRPIVDMRRGLQGETLTLYRMLPALRDLEGGPLSNDEMQRFTDKLLGLVGLLEGGDMKPATVQQRLAFTAGVAKLYPTAKAALIASGRAREQVEALPALQVVAIHEFREYIRMRDDSLKWYSVPYWQGRAGLQQAEKEIKALPEGSVARTLHATVGKVYFAGVRAERRTNALRCVEAIRLYAARTGKMPETLDAIIEVPVPTDPVTGKAFEYRFKAGMATLHGPPPAGDEANVGNSFTYELTLGK